MDHPLQRLLDNNRRWARAEVERDPAFFEKLLRQQTPEYLWIGCSDSRVPANQITGLAPGEVFVHRNVGNLVVHTDLNCLSVIDFAVDLLKVKHVIVVGHHGCSGVRLALQRAAAGLAENWLRHIQDVHRAHAGLVDPIADEERRVNLLAELNVVEQAVHVCQSTVVQSAWRRGAGLTVHGWIYSLHNGLLVDLGFAAAGSQQVAAARNAAMDRIAERYRAS
ncbi:MAG: carbonate dehydratase [Burkholderiaceae bacterium]|nr:carbonate dehydratase [Burkholderiaceae bacterium]